MHSFLLESFCVCYIHVWPKQHVFMHMLKRSTCAHSSTMLIIILIIIILLFLLCQSGWVTGISQLVKFVLWHRPCSCFLERSYSFLYYNWTGHLMNTNNIWEAFLLLLLFPQIISHNVFGTWWLYWTSELSSGCSKFTYLPNSLRYSSLNVKRLVPLHSYIGKGYHSAAQMHRQFSSSSESPRNVTIAMKVCLLNRSTSLFLREGTSGMNQNREKLLATAKLQLINWSFSCPLPTPSRHITF